MDDDLISPSCSTNSSTSNHHTPPVEQIAVPREGPFLVRLCAGPPKMSEKYHPVICSGQSAPPFVWASNVPALSAAVVGDGSTVARISEDASIINESQNRSRAPNWCDAETRFLLELWRDRLPISKRRNSSAWASIAKHFNKMLAKHGLSNFRSGVQCKARMKYLEDEYKRAKANKGRSGANKPEAPFAYLEEMDAALSQSNKPQTNPIKVVRIAPRSFEEHPVTLVPTPVVVCQSAAPVATGLNPTTAVCSTASEEQPPPISTPSILPLPEAEFINSATQSRASDVEEEAPLTKSVPREKEEAVVTQHTGPSAKTVATISGERSFALSDFTKFLEQSQKREHEFFQMLMEKEGERELQRQKMMVDMVKEVAKIIKGDK